MSDFLLKNTETKRGILFEFYAWCTILFKEIRKYSIKT